jgi:hypothetical protein
LPAAGRRKPIERHKTKNGSRGFLAGGSGLCAQQILCTLEVIAKLLGARASRPQILEKRGILLIFPALPEGFAITSLIQNL